ncbi:NACHT nucleoside triphosphatase [Niveomyces insectorum RCEF 264]|uniref:NACHT nucleoside triphosphatase n=1 Tax=Niveomyces insectorum RCEF 264 TaxID=1081102 RepID=A0A167YTD2_9HYPO|nr:NACHT nucleoside triphosphatase [Niveomyces insectorum RCEF 264]
MDPLTALGLASNIVQFVDFALKLYSASAEIVGSARGATTHNHELDTVYTRLQTFTSELKLAADGEPSTPADGHSTAGALENAPGNAHTKAIQPHVTAIEQIAAECRVVCGQLLDVVNGLRVDPTASNRRLRSLGAALKTAFGTKKIAGLEERLKRFQALLALHFFPLLNERQAYMTQVLRTLESQNNSLAAEQSSRFKTISSQLDVLLNTTQTLSSKNMAHHDTSQSSSNASRRRAAETKTKAMSTHEPYDNGPCLRLPDMKGLSELLDGLSLAEKDLTAVAKEQALLRSLDFRSRTYRYEAIPEAHKATFEWIFADRQQRHPPYAVLDSAAKTTETPINFKAWLESGQGIFWISGKAGAGKSTLMKFVANHAKTQSALQKWSGTKKVIIASHYFWSAGTRMQKTFKGLLQELVFDVLRHCPELAHNVFPRRLQMWTSTSSWTMGSTCVGSPEDNVWTVAELLEGLQQIARHPALPVRCCFFIDGLDEYATDPDTDHFKLCQTLKSLTTSDNLKCCVSSRPWNVFEDAFGSASGNGGRAAFLRVHELTYKDIKLFAENRLQNNARWKHMGIDDEQTESLARYITEHAQGVFLWVFLVTKSLREGVIDGDTFHDLQKRLKAVPTALEPYFKHMLDCVDAAHHSYMAQTLQIALNTTGLLELAVYYVAEDELQDTNYALTWPPDFDAWRVNLHPEFYLPCRRRINARCGGLLDINKYGVGFIHRTVHDFLQTGTMQDYLASKVRPGFQPNLSTLRAQVYLFRCVARTVATSTGDASADYMERLWERCLKCAGPAMEEDEDATMQLLDVAADVQQEQASADKASFLQDAIDGIIRKSVATTGTALRDTPRGSRSKTRLAQHRSTGSGNAESPGLPGLHHTYLCAGVDGYVLDKLKTDPHYFDAPGVSLLGTILRSDTRWTEARVDVVCQLLENGCDPNEMYRRPDDNDAVTIRRKKLTTPWEELFDVAPYGEPRLVTTSIGRYIVAAFLRHGASRRRIIERHRAKNVCAVWQFLERNFGESAPAQPNIRAVFETVDVFLEASPDDNRAQLEDVMQHIQTWSKFPPRFARAEEKRATAEFVAKLILMAVRLGLPANAFYGVIANKAFRTTVSPRVLTALKNYMEPNAVRVPASLLPPSNTDVKRRHCDGELAASVKGTKRLKTEPRSPSFDGDASNPIVVD